jgi:stage V sporulation protein AE
VYEETEKNGILGIFTGGLKACSGGVSVAVLFSMLAALIFEPKDKK